MGKKVFDRQTNKLRNGLIDLGEKVEEQVEDAIRCLINQDEQLAKKVIEADSEIDQIEVEIEEECLKILALHQPVANDLRLIVAVLKINNDLERVGDLARKIAKCSEKLTLGEDFTMPDLIERMAKKTKLMLKKSLLSFFELDVELSKDVLGSDDEIDNFNRELRDWTKNQIKQDPDNADRFLLVLAISEALERVADLASNIAEDVIYLLQGDIVRHGLHPVEPTQ